MKGLSETDKDNIVTVLFYWCSALDLQPHGRRHSQSSKALKEGRKDSHSFSSSQDYLFCSVCFFPCLQSHQILPSQQPYCLCILHEYYQENVHGCKVTCCTGRLHVKCLDVPPRVRDFVPQKKKKMFPRLCLYTVYIFFNLIMNNIIISTLEGPKEGIFF